MGEGREANEEKGEKKRSKPKPAQIFYLWMESAAHDVERWPGGRAVAMVSWLRPPVIVARWEGQSSVAGGYSAVALSSLVAAPAASFCMQRRRFELDGNSAVSDLMWMWGNSRLRLAAAVRP